MFLAKNFPVGQRVLVDSSFGQPTPGEGRKEEATRQGGLPVVREVLLVGLGARQSRPYLLVSAYGVMGLFVGLGARQSRPYLLVSAYGVMGLLVGLWGYLWGWGPGRAGRTCW